MKKFRNKKSGGGGGDDQDAARLAALREIMGLEEGQRLPETFHVDSDGGLTKNSCTIIAPAGSQAGDILVVTTANGGEVFQMPVPDGIVEMDKFELNLNTYEPIYGIVGRALPKKPESAKVITDDKEEINKPQYRRKPEILSRPSWGLEKLRVARSLSTDEANKMVRSRSRFYHPAIGTTSALDNDAGSITESLFFVCSGGASIRVTLRITMHRPLNNHSLSIYRRRETIRSPRCGPNPDH